MKTLRSFLLALLFPLLVTPVFASPPSVVYEPFDQPIQYRQPGVASSYPWWVINDYHGAQYYGAPCGPSDATCLFWQTENGDSFARFIKNPDTNFGTGGYNNVELSAQQTGYTYGQGQWLPTVGHPVIMTETVRFGPNYNQNGSGGAVGSAGGGLWNSYPDYPNQTLHPITAIWWSWAEQGTAFGLLDSLSVSVFKENNLLRFQKVTAPLSMQDWMTWTITWAAIPNDPDHQNVTFTVTQNGNTTNLGTTTVPAITTPLSITNWNDNQFVAGFTPEGQPIPTFHNPSAQDYWDLSRMAAVQN